MKVVVHLPHFQFRIYVAGHTPNSVLAMSNLRSLCAKYLAGRHEIEVVDVFRNPERALADRVLMTPTLLKLQPLPVARVVGSLSDIRPILQALDIDEWAAES